MAQQNYRENLEATIANGAALSDAQRIVNTAVVGLVLPAAWTAAGIGFHVSYDDGSTYVQLCVTDLTASPPYGLDEFEILAADVPTGESVFIALDPALMLGATHVKINSQTAGSGVNQGAARTVYLVIRDIQA